MLKPSFLLLGVMAALLPLSPALGETHDPQPYNYCDSSTFKQNTGLKVLITTTKRDMSKMTRRQLAETALSAARHYGGNHAVVNVLLRSGCTGGAFTLARAQTEWGKVTVLNALDKSHGPGAMALKVSDEVGGMTQGLRTTTDDDYKTAGQALGISADKAKKLHMELATSLEPCPQADGTPAMPPSR
ncbi:hypothetical protein [uncultured Desulfovibrio sp.]|uniref:hypothetical protein n=1 Tax=uncultured Desulfovibrio sp. TaxID=167968 RepID=UPI00258B0610|nr:hypothetical protein [uncultured Desulfovibrio sp.]